MKFLLRTAEYTVACAQRSPFPLSGKKRRLRYAVANCVPVPCCLVFNLRINYAWVGEFDLLSFGLQPIQKKITIQNLLNVIPLISQT